ncbi:MAG: DUF3943 domain-containing protein [Acidobacteriota bacterium]
MTTDEAFARAGLVCLAVAVLVGTPAVGQAQTAESVAVTQSTVQAAPVVALPQIDGEAPPRLRWDAGLDVPFLPADRGWRDPAVDLNDPLAPDVRPASRPRQTGRATIEMGTFIAWSAANYWRKYASFVEDWQFRLTWKDQARKWFTSEGLRLDSNNMRLNWTHGAAGGVYYSFGRSNGFGAGESFLFAAAGSVLWEYGAEWREISSINDHVFTAVGGMAIAEPLFQFGSYFRNRPGAANRLAAVATNPLVALNDLLDGANRPTRTPTSRWHDFRLSTGAVRGLPLPDSAAETLNVVNLDLRLVTLPDYGVAGKGSGRFRDTIDAGFHADVHASGSRVEEFNLGSRALLFGRWWKDVGQDDAGVRRGHDLWVGIQVAWDVFQKKPIAPYDGHDLGMKDQWFPREQPTRYTDKGSSVHLPGPTVGLTMYAGKLRTRLDLGAALNFSMINSLPFNQYSATHDTWGVKTTLQNWGYYYALGATLTGSAEAEYGAWSAAANLDYRRFGSIQGLDRYQNQVTDDGRLVDSRLVTAASLTVRLPRTPVFATVAVRGIDRRGWFHETAAHVRETRVSYEMGVNF